MLPGRVYTPEDIVRIAWRHKWLIVSTVSVLTTIVIALSMRLPDLYRAETLILVIPAQVPEAFVRSTVTIRIEDRLRSIRQEILSRERLERIIHDFSLYADDKRPVELIVEEMRSNADVDTDRDDAFKVTFVDQQPRIAMIVADRLAAMVIDQNVRDREGQSMGTNEFLESQLAEARKRLEVHEKRLEVYRRQYSGELPTQLSSNLQVIQSTQNQIQTLTESINRDRDRRLSLEQSMNETIDSSVGTDATARSAGPTSETGRLQAEIDAARDELQAMRERLKPEHPDIVARTRALARLEAKARDAAGAADASPGMSVTSSDQIRRGRARQYQGEIEKLDVQIAGKEAEMQRLRQVMSDYQRRIDAIPGHESELTALMRDYDTLQKVYVDLLGKKEASQISANLERQEVGERFRIIDSARLPEEPISPNRPQFALIAAAAGLLLSLVMIAFLEYRDTSLRTEDEIVRTLTLPVVAAIPLMLAVADVKRQRRNSRLVGAFTFLTVCGLSAAILQMMR